MSAALTRAGAIRSPKPRRARLCRPKDARRHTSLPEFATVALGQLLLRLATTNSAPQLLGKVLPLRLSIAAFKMLQIAGAQRR